MSVSTTSSLELELEDHWHSIEGSPEHEKCVQKVVCHSRTKGKEQPLKLLFTNWTNV